MADILFDFPIVAPAAKVFEAISTPQGLDSWWSERCAGEPRPGAGYELWFGPEYDWRAIVSRCTPNTEFELTMAVADADWAGSRVSFTLAESDGVTNVRFQHLGWPTANEHYRISGFCWAMYLRHLKRYVEFGEVVPYEERLEER